MKGYFCVDSCGACSGNRTVEDASLGRRLDALEPGHGCPRPFSKWRPQMSPGVSSLNSRPVNTGRLLPISYYVIIECFVFVVWIPKHFCTCMVRVCHLLILDELHEGSFPVSCAWQRCTFQPLSIWLWQVPRCPRELSSARHLSAIFIVFGPGVSFQNYYSFMYRLSLFSHTKLSARVLKAYIEMLIKLIYSIQTVIFKCTM